MEILNIKCTNFKQIRDAEFNFEHSKGLWSIHGPIGTGKTSIAELILFGLFGRLHNIVNGDLIRFGEKKATVDAVLNCRGHRVEIHREITSSASAMSVLVDGEELQYTNKRNCQEILEKEYYDVTREVIERLCIISFAGFNGILDSSRTECSGFLNRTFGFDYIDDIVRMAKQYAKTLENNVSSGERTLAELKSQESRLSGLNTTYNETLVTDLKARLTVIKDEITKMSSELTTYNNERATEYKRMSDTLSDIKVNGGIVRDKLNKLKSGVCPTCGAPVSVDDISGLEKRRNELLAEYNEQNKKCKAYDEETREHANDIRERISELNSERESINISIRHEEENKKRADEMQRVIGAITERRTSIENEVRDNKYTKELCSELQYFVTSDVKSKTLAVVIPQLNKTVQSYIEEFNQPFTVIFNDVFECFIYSNLRNSEISIDTLSTGQKKIVDMAIILSLLDVLMSGVKFNVFFLDELLYNIDYENRDTVCKVIKNHLKAGQTMYIISHERIDEKNFDGAIRVRTVGGCSDYQLFDY